MFVILVDEYFEGDETPCDTTVDGYFTAKEYAHEYLIDKGFQYCFDTNELFDEVIETEIYERISDVSSFYHQARVVELELIK